MKRTVFASSEFKREAQRFVLLKVDVTRQDEGFPPDTVDMFRKYKPGTEDGALPLPTILFIDSKGEELRSLRAMGAEPVDLFLSKMKEVS
jgi:thiol:disulfide interchange protein